MPLSFETLNRGTIAFGFFNIDSDLLLLDRVFVFAPEFCEHVCAFAQDPGETLYEASWDVDRIDDPMEMGDLMGAIHNIRHIGFIGEVYRRYPFPSNPEDFRQKPEGYQTRDEIREILDRYAQAVTLPFSADPEQGVVTIGNLWFARESFLELVQYVWLGGYPRWRGMQRPFYVQTMKDRVEASRNPVFEGFVFSREVV
ncbi:MAG: hypothetical protein PVG49_16310 [Desulfobacteraceae bacterium]